MEGTENSYVLLASTNYLSRFDKLFRTLISHKVFQGTILFVVFLSFLYLVQFSTADLAGNDGYYHIRFAKLMRLEGLKPDFPWLPLTILNSGEFYDHHFLFHVALIPFTFGDLVLGAKWASIIFTSLTFLCIWWLLRGQQVPFAALWAIGLMAISSAFIYRMNMPRAQSLSLAILVLGFHFLLHKKFLYLLPLSFIYVWTYDGFPLILILTGIYILSVWLIDREINLRPLIFVLGGISLGLMINPYFPHNVIFTIRHTIPKLLNATSVRVGNEWYPYDTGQLLENSFFTLILFLSGIVALGLHNKRMDVKTAAALFMAIFTGLLLFQARRFIEYFPPFVLIFSAFALTPLFTQWIKLHWNWEEVSKLLEQKPGSFSRGSIARWLIPGVVFAVILVGMWSTFSDAQSSMMKSKPADRYAQASIWLNQNTPEGTRVFQTDWDDFPRLFFYNTWNTYLVGLDPTYLQIKDGDLYDLWVDITKGRVAGPGSFIYDRFAADYVITDLAHNDFIDEAEADDSLTEVYKDKDAIVYRVIPAERAKN